MGGHYLGKRSADADAEAFYAPYAYGAYAYGAYPYAYGAYHYGVPFGSSTGLDPITQGRDPGSGVRQVSSCSCCKLRCIFIEIFLLIVAQPYNVSRVWTGGFSATSVSSDIFLVGIWRINFFPAK